MLEPDCLGNRLAVSRHPDNAGTHFGGRGCTLPTAKRLPAATELFAFHFFCDPICECNDSTAEEECAESKLEDQHNLNRFRDEEIVCENG